MSRIDPPCRWYRQQRQGLSPQVRRGRADVMASDCDLIVVGGGPAGVMAGLLFARAGCDVRIFEKHEDFFRDFRGDTVHPSTMEILDQLGMLQRFLARPHDRVAGAELRVAGREWTIGDLSHLRTPAPFIAMMPQWDFLIPKGAAEAFQARGIQAIRDEVAAAAPPDLDLAELDDISDLHLLTVKLDRLTCWQRPGLLAIGDAAHAMSPIGGIGINLAIQDAVAAANYLAGPLARGDDVDPLLHKVEDRRLLPTRLIQWAQKFAQDRIIGRLLQARAPITKAPLAIRVLNRFPLLRRIPGRFIGLGIRRERVRSPAAVPRP